MFGLTRRSRRLRALSCRRVDGCLSSSHETREDREVLLARHGESSGVGSNSGMMIGSPVV